jgi:hypothetical protein
LTKYMYCTCKLIINQLFGWCANSLFSCVCEIWQCSGGCSYEQRN